MTISLNGTTGITDVNGTAAAPAITGTDTDSGMYFGTNIVALATNGTNAVYVDASQNVGIGTSSPGAKLDVNPASGTIFRAFTNGVAQVLIGNGGASTNYYDGDTQIFRSGNATERVRIDSSGNLLVGGVSNFGFRFQSEALSTQSAAYFYRATATTTDNVLTLSSAVGGVGSTRLVILASGNVQNVNNSYGAISDIKLKENITDATPKLVKINQIRIVNYNIIGDEQKQIGVIAQELEQVFPGMVEESPDLDKEGNNLGTATKSVKYSVFVPMLIKAIQEQQALITSLTDRIAALEAR